MRAHFILYVDDQTRSTAFFRAVLGKAPSLDVPGMTEFELGVEAVLGRDEFIGSLARMTPDDYMGDQSDIMIRLEFEEPPLWDFFVRGSTIAHSQPVF